MTVKIKDEAKSLIDQLDDVHVKEMLDFMRWLRDRKEWEATHELMSIEGFEKKYEEGLTALNRGDRILLGQIENG